MKLEWEKLYTNDKYEMWIAQTTIGQCYIRHGFERDHWCAGVGVFDYTEDVTNFEAAEQYINESHNGRVAAIAATNGYVKAEDYEALKAKVAELTDQLEDATSTLDLIESEADLFDDTAIASGYVKLEPGQVVVDSNYDGVHKMLNDIETAGLQVLAQTSDETLSDMTPRFAYECGIKGIIGVIRDQIQKAIKEARNDH